MNFVVTLQLAQRVKLLKEALHDWQELSDVNKTV